MVSPRGSAGPDLVLLIRECGEKEVRVRPSSCNSPNDEYDKMNETTPDESTTESTPGPDSVKPDIQQMVAAVEERPAYSATCLEVHFDSDEEVVFSTDDGDLMRLLLNHDDCCPTEIRVITGDGYVRWISPSEYSGDRITSVEAEFDPSDLNDGIDVEYWDDYANVVSRTLAQVGVTTDEGIGGVILPGVKDQR